MTEPNKAANGKIGKVDSAYMEGLWQNRLFYPPVVLVKKSQVFKIVSKSVV
jgi:hypothetical protein